jgi:preprotein translocase subunit SecA
VKAIREDVVNNVINSYIAPGSMDEQWAIPGLEAAMETEFAQKFDIQGWLDADDDLHEETLREKILDELAKAYAEKEALAGPENMRHFEKSVMLQVLDQSWKEHLAAMDYLRQGIHLRGYAQKNPKQEYKREAFEMFTGLLERIKMDVVSVLSKFQVRSESDVAAVDEQRRRKAEMQYRHDEASAMQDAAGEESPPGERQQQAQPFVRDGRKIGRNEPCPCGSGKKYKQCHGKLS